MSTQRFQYTRLLPPVGIFLYGVIGMSVVGEAADRWTAMAWYLAGAGLILVAVVSWILRDILHRAKTRRTWRNSLVAQPLPAFEPSASRPLTKQEQAALRQSGGDDLLFFLPIILILPILLGYLWLSDPSPETNESLRLFGLSTLIMSGGGLVWWWWRRRRYQHDQQENRVDFVSGRIHKDLGRRHMPLIYCERRVFSRGQVLWRPEFIALYRTIEEGEAIEFGYARYSQRLLVARSLDRPELSWVFTRPPQDPLLSHDRWRGDLAEATRQGKLPLLVIGALCTLALVLLMLLGA